MTKRYALREDQWERIRDLLPGRVGHVGGTAKDNRLFVEAVLYRYRAGIPWRTEPTDESIERNSINYTPFVGFSAPAAEAHAGPGLKSTSGVHKPFRRIPIHPRRKGYLRRISI